MLHPPRAGVRDYRGRVAEANTPWWHGQLTQIPTISTVQREIERIVSRKYGGWREGDREDLVSLVLEKYLNEFGKNDQKWPMNKDGERVVPTGWLRKVATNAAIDLHRKAEARPADLVDFDASAGDDHWDAKAALRDLATPSLMNARGVAAERALDALNDADRDLLRWALVDDVGLTEIATRTGKSYEATKRAVQRALTRLRKVVLDDPELRDALFDRPDYPLM